MSEVQAYESVIFDRYLAQFPALLQPEYRSTDFLGENGLLGMGGWNDLEYDPVSQCLFPQRVRMWHDNLFTGGPATTGAWPTVSWSAVVTSGAISLQGQKAYPHAFLEVQAGYTSMTQPPSTSLSCSATLTPVCQGFSFQFSIGAEQTSGSSPTQLSLTWTVGTDTSSSTTTYELVIPVGSDPYIVRTVGGTSSKVGKLKLLSKKEHLLRPFSTQDQIHVEVLLMGGYMHVSFGDEIQPWVYQERTQVGASNSIVWAITQVALSAQNFDQIRFSLHPTKFLKVLPQPGNPAMSSGQQALGFTPLNDPTFTVHYAPDQEWKPLRDKVANTTGQAPPGCSITASMDTSLSAGAVLVYDLAWSNAASTSGFTAYQGQTFSDFTAAVRAVSWHYEAIEFSVVSNPIQMYPEDIQVEWFFDFNTLQIRSSATLIFNNFNGQAAQFFDNSGHMAVQIQMGIQPFPLDTYFTGIANVDFEETNPGGGRSSISVSCADFWMPMMTEVYGLPFFDSWNSYYGAYFLSQLGGVVKDRMNFAPYIPSDPYDITPGDVLDGSGNYANTYFLPTGPAGTPITRFPGPQVKGDIQLKLARQIGFITFFDQFANLSFTKFIPPSPVPQTILTETATGTLSEMWNLQYSGTLRDTRNSVTCLGIDPVTGYPVVGHAQDPALWDDSLPTFKGYIDPVIWTDQQFVDAGYAGAAAAYLLSFLMWPGRTMRATSWMPIQGFISPLTVVGISASRSGANGKSFIVYGARYHRRKDSAPEMSLAGRWFFTGGG